MIAMAKAALNRRGYNRGPCNLGLLLPSLLQYKLLLRSWPGLRLRTANDGTQGIQYMMLGLMNDFRRQFRLTTVGNIRTYSVDYFSDRLVTLFSCRFCFTS